MLRSERRFTSFIESDLLRGMLQELLCWLESVPIKCFVFLQLLDFMHFCYEILILKGSQLPLFVKLIPKTFDVIVLQLSVGFLTDFYSQGVLYFLVRLFYYKSSSHYELFWVLLNLSERLGHIGEELLVEVLDLFGE